MNPDYLNTLHRILNATDGAHYVYRDADRELLYVWHGGASVNVYSTHNGKCVDCFTHTKESTRDNPNGYLTRAEMHASIVETIDAD